jgi:hypothetical protein
VTDGGAGTGPSIGRPVDLSVRTTAFREFWRERHLCTLTTPRADGSPHVVPVGVTLDAATATARVLASRRSTKVQNLLAAAAVAAAAGTPAAAAAGTGRSGGADPAASATGVRVAVCQVDGARWSTLEGLAVVRGDAESVAQGVRRYRERYREPRPNPDRVVIEIAVTRVLGLR